MKILSIAVDLPLPMLWQGKEDGNGKPFSSLTLRGDGKICTSLECFDKEYVASAEG
jgi:hypothetical protein